MSHDSELSHLPAFLLSGIHGYLDASCIIAVTDLRGDIVFANEQFAKISGYSKEDLIGKNHRILKSNVHPPEFYQDMWRTIAKGDVWHGEICNRAKDGSIYWVDSTLHPICDSSGKLRYYFALRQDITEKKRLQQELIEKIERDARAERMAALGRMADAVCHDLNNLLTGALMMADLIEIQDRKEASSFRDSLGKMAQLIRNIRDFSTGRPTSKRQFRLGHLVADAIKLACFRQIRSGEIAVNFRIDSLSGCEVLANEGQIFEIILNLATNAAEALVGISNAEILVDGSIEKGDGGDLLHIDIQDNGPGVPVSIRDRLFEAFESTKGDGRGMGLSAARSLAVAHGGNLLLLESNKGARFRLTLPLVEKAVMPAAAVIPSDNRVVLLMEDEEPVATRLEEALGARGFRVILSASADEIILRASQFGDALCAAVLDSAGTNANFALVGLLRNYKSSLPVLLTSASLNERGRRETRHGPVMLLPKPFLPSEVLAILDDFSSP